MGERKRRMNFGERGSVGIYLCVYVMDGSRKQAKWHYFVEKYFVCMRINDLSFELITLRDDHHSHGQPPKHVPP